MFDGYLSNAIEGNGGSIGRDRDGQSRWGNFSRTMRSRDRSQQPKTLRHDIWDHEGRREMRTTLGLKEVLIRRFLKYFRTIHPLAKVELVSCRGPFTDTRRFSR